MFLFRKLVSAPISSMIVLSRLWATLTTTPYVSRSFVVGVGSPFAGGAGKTELAHFCYSVLADYNPLLLLKGYRGRIKQPTLLTPSSASATLFGDEAAMLAQRGARVAVSHNKWRGVLHFETNFPVIIIDDSLQHNRLATDLTIMTVPIEDERTLALAQREIFFPLGPLRDFFSGCIKRSDCIVFIDRSGNFNDISQAELYQLSPEKPKFLAYYDIKLPTTNQISLVTSIARPNALVSALSRAGIEIINHFEFPDHHLFSQSEVHGIEQASKGLIVTTIKDWVKIENFADPERWFILEPTVKFRDEAAFKSYLNSKVHAGLVSKRLLS